MRDIIYRDEAIEICERWRQRAKEHHDRDGWYMADILLRFMKEMPSADRLTGEWLLLDDEHHIEKIYLCSNCKSFEAWGESEKYNYCPTCGARMKGADDE